MDAQIATNGEGDYALGFTVDGAFIPLATVASHRVAHLVERQATLKARADDPAHEGNKQALDAIEHDWTVVDSKAAKAGSSSSSKSTSTETKEA